MGDFPVIWGLLINLKGCGVSTFVPAPESPSF